MADEQGGQSLGGVYVDVSARTGSVKADFAGVQGQAKQVEATLNNLRALYTSGSITAAEYQSRLADLAGALNKNAAALDVVRDMIDRETASMAAATTATNAGTAAANSSTAATRTQAAAMGDLADQTERAAAASSRASGKGPAAGPTGSGPPVTGGGGPDASRADYSAMLSQIKRAEAALVSLKNEYISGAIKTAEYRSRQVALTESLDRQRAAVQAVRDQIDQEAASVSHATTATQRYIAQTGAAAAGTGQAGGSASKAGYQFMQFGQTLDDLQYVGEMGLRPIINNVMQVSAVLGVVMIAGNLLYTHWDKLMALMGTGAEKVKSEAEAMDELAKKTEKTANETERLNKYKERKDFGENVSKASDKEEGSFSKIQELIRNNKGGGKALIGKLAAQQEKEGRDKSLYLNPDDQGELKELRRRNGLYNISAKDKTRLAELEEKAGDARTDSITKQLYEGARSPEKQKQLIRQVEQVDPELANKIKNEGTVEAADKKEKADNYKNSDSVRRFAEQKKAAEDFAEAHNAEVAKREEERQRDAAKAKEDYDREVEQNRDKFAGDAARSSQDDYEKEFLRAASGESGLTGQRVDAQFNQKTKRFLTSSGLIEDDETAGDLADRTTTKAREAAAAKLRDRMMKDQISQEEAAKRLLEEQRKKEEQKATSEGNKGERADDRERNEAEKQARELMTGADDRIRSELMNARLSGANRNDSEDAVITKLQRALEGEGMDKKSAELAAEEMVDKASRKLEEDVFQSGYGYKGEQQQKAQAPQSLGAMEYLKHVQAGVVGNTHERKVEDLLRMIYQSNVNQTDALNRPRPAVIGD